MSSCIAVFAMFAAGNRFVSLKFRVEGSIGAVSKKLVGTYVTVTKGSVFWHQPVGQAIKIFTGCQEDPEFGLCPAGLEEACSDTDLYLACCLTQDEWLAENIEGTYLPLYWWSLTENTFAHDGRRTAFGPVITSH